MVETGGIPEENVSLGLLTATGMAIVVDGNGQGLQAGVYNCFKVHGLMTKPGRNVLTRVEPYLIRLLTVVGIL
jgi:hypothetical protein